MAKKIEWADTASPEHLMCRDTGIRHQWEPHNAAKNGTGFVEMLLCGRCGAEKERYITRTGSIVKTKFSYPEGYVRQGGGRITKDENALIRLLSLKGRYSL